MKRLIKTALQAIFIVVFSTPIAFSDNTDHVRLKEIPEVPVRISSDSLAINMALAYTGFEDLTTEGNLETVVTWNKPPDQNTMPFVGGYIEKSNVVRVDILNVPVELSSYHNNKKYIRSECVRDFSVYLDIDDGYMLYIESLSERYNSDMIESEPDYKESEKYFEGGIPIKYQGMPEYLPNVKLLEVFNTILGTVCNYGKVQVCYMNMTWGSHACEDSWLIIGRELSTPSILINKNASDTSKYINKTLCEAVNGQTGKRIFMTSALQK
jgi:hypothetical protein